MNISDLEFKQMREAVEGALAKTTERQREFADRLLDLEQKGARGTIGGHGGGDAGELADLITKDAGFVNFTKGHSPSCSIAVPGIYLRKAAIVNQPSGVDNPLVAPARAGAIAAAPRRRLTIRGLFTALETTSDMIETPTESSFTNNAAPQGGDASPTGRGETSLKNESLASFSLTKTPVVTIAHYANASRQVLADSRVLARYLESVLLSGLAEEEEDEMLTGTGASGTMNGINNQASAFTGGVTNATRLDTLARGANQLAVNNYEPSGFILHPTDWLSVQLEKDTTGRYVFGDPGAQVTPMLWGLPVVPTPAQTLGNFTVLDAAKCGVIYDREDATVRISENVNDSFIRNIITLLAEVRTVLVVERSAAAVYGSLTYAG